MHMHNVINKEENIDNDRYHRELKRQRYISATKKKISEYQWDYFITLTFKHPVFQIDRVLRAVKQFVNKLSRKAYGGRSKKRVVCFAVIEKDKSDCYHVHLLLQDPTDNISNPERKKGFHLRREIIIAWLQAGATTGNPARSSPDGEWMKPIFDVNEVIGYMLKHYSLDSDSPTTIMWEEASVDGRRIS